MAVAEDAPATGSAADKDVTVVLTIVDEAPSEPVLDADHVVEGSLHVPSGRLVVMGCTDFEPDVDRFDVSPGCLRVHVRKSNMTAAKQAGIDSDDDPANTERLDIQVWPAPDAPTTVWKRRTPPTP